MATTESVPAHGTRAPAYTLSEVMRRQLKLADAQIANLTDIQNRFVERVERAQQNLDITTRTLNVVRESRARLAEYLAEGERELHRPPSDPPIPEEDLQLGGVQ